MAVLSVDLAFRRWSDLGIVILARQGTVPAPLDALPEISPAAPPPDAAIDSAAPSPSPIRCEIIAWNDPGSVDANILAGRLNHLCGTRDIRILMLDGPQAWKSRDNGLEHARVSERALNTAAKTGLPGMVKPVTYRPFAEFCLDVYDGLCRRGWRRLETSHEPCISQQRVLVESYPHAAWKALGLKPLASRRRAGGTDLAEALASLQTIMPVQVDAVPTHDQLQAIIGGLPGLALEEQDAAGAQIVGKPPRREDGHWREGFIVLPVPPRRTPVNLRWLH